MLCNGLTRRTGDSALCVALRMGLRIAFGVVWIAAAAVESAEAETVRSIVSPGPVIAGHADVEAQCEKCHLPFDKTAQNQLCLSCHEDIAADLDTASGAHGKTFVRKGTQCRQCHTDHRGRAFDIVALDAAVFRHEGTDYPLTGAHVAVDCEQCHAKDETPRSAPSDCKACHEVDDPHRGSLGLQCGTCHETANWTGGKFDHSTTEFPLRGAHRETECAGCHPSERYAETPEPCVGCHRVDDAHDGERGERCGDCHAETEWKKAKFDHDTTALPLRGAHVAVGCVDCHASDVNAPLEVACVACHAEDDVHKGEQGERCETCHDERDWAEQVRFDHDLARFPLAGMHSVTACEACHSSGRYRDTPRDCIACHRSDDAHEGRLGERCVDCHSPESWSRWEFDHGVRTRFTLDGAHEDLGCETCHVRSSVEVAKPRMECASCHERDDVHAGVFGTACQRCHDTADFRAALGPVR
jgi:hypothetical protein